MEIIQTAETPKPCDSLHQISLPRYDQDEADTLPGRDRGRHVTETDGMIFVSAVPIVERVMNGAAHSPRIASPTHYYLALRPDQFNYLVLGFF